MGLRPSVHDASRHNEKDHSDIHNDARSSTASMQNDSSGENSNPRESSSASLPPVQRQAWTARGQLLLNFHDVISRAINSPEMIQKCSEIAAGMSDHDHVVSNSLTEDYSAEANLIIENKARRDAEVRNKTIYAGLCLFGMLRGVRGVRSWIKNAAANRYAMLSGYRFDALPPSSGANPLKTPTHTPPQAIEPTKSQRFIRLAVDVTISTTIAIISGEFLFIPRPSSYIEDMAKLPLVEGKSLYAEVVCPPLLKEYKRVLKQYGRWPVIHANTNNADKKEDTKTVLTQEDVSLNIIRTFAENCSKRAKYEQALLHERNAFRSHSNPQSGLELIHRISNRHYSNQQKEEWIKLGAVIIPTGGVPEEVSVDLDSDVLSLEDPADIPSKK
ncbi:hypothetical protein ACHAW6_015563 [Cyclotella cf. meneghiniana]